MPRPQSGRTRDLLEMVLGFGLILAIIWMPDSLQRIFSPIALVATASVVLARRHSLNELGLGAHGFLRSLWILPATLALVFLSMWLAKTLGTLHPLYKGDLAHVSGYILWTIYQQFLLQDYFMPRLLRLLPDPARAVAVAAVLFAAAHLPNLPLTAATLVWGAVSCLLFRRYRNLWALGLAQGLLGLGFAVCVPDALHHHLRVGLGYLRYRSAQ
jgi:hypothetical protein